MISIQEANCINRYKRYAAKYFKDKQKLSDFFYPNYDEKINLESYLRELRIYKKKLAKYVKLRNDHYLNYIENKKEEDVGHKFFRESLMYILSDCEDKYEHWSRMKYNKLETEIVSDESESSDEESNESFINDEIPRVMEDLSNEIENSPEMLDILNQDQQLFNEIKTELNGKKTVIELKNLNKGILLDHLLCLYNESSITFIGSDDEKYETCKQYIYLAKPIYISILAKDQEMKLFILAIVCQLLHNIKNLDVIINKLDNILHIFFKRDELLYLEMTQHPFLSKKLKYNKKIYMLLNKILIERKATIYTHELNDRLSLTCDYLIEQAPQLLSTIELEEMNINKFSILALKLEEDVTLLLKKNPKNEMFVYHLDKSENESEHRAILTLEVIIYFITQKQGRFILNDNVPLLDDINLKIKYLYNVLFEFVIQSSILKAIYYLEAAKLDRSIGNVILTGNLLNLLHNINQHVHQMKRRNG